MAMRLPELSCSDDVVPQARLLSNGHYTVMLTGAGTGASACGGYALTFWGGDRTEDSDGLFIYLRDLDTRRVWSAGRQPVRQRPTSYVARAEPGGVHIERVDDSIETHLDVSVAASADVELRRLRLRNGSERPRRLEVTTYAEVVLLDPAAHAAHPAFAKLFVETAYVPAQQVLLACRRPRSHTEQHPWLMHALRGDGDLEQETDRVRFVGRGRTLAAPIALASADKLSGTTGSVLDPVFSLRRIVSLAPGQTTELLMLLGTAATRDAALELADRFTSPSVFDDTAVAAAQHERDCQRQLGISPTDAESYQAVACAMRYGHPALRASEEIVKRTSGGLDALWRYGIGGGLLAVAQVQQADDPVLPTLVSAHAYWRAHGVGVKLVVLCEGPAALVESVQAKLRNGPAGDTPDAIALRLADIPASHPDMMRARADLVLQGQFPTLSAGASRPLPAASFRRLAPDPAARPRKVIDGVRSANGYGDFRPDGSEYQMQIEVGEDHVPRLPPMPWVNVVANETCGFLVSECGAGGTWSRNSRENRITPWYNDPVSDPFGEAFYVRDERTGVFWSPLPGPAAPPASFETRHGFGYSSWRHRSADLEQEVTMLVPQQPADPVKITRLTLTNSGVETRRLSLFAYTRLVLGVTPAETARFIVTERDQTTGAVLARNRVNGEFGDGVVFAAAVMTDATPVAVHWTTDRTAFVGREGGLDEPAALTRDAALDGRTGTGLDPCIALQVIVDVPAGGRVECAFLAGRGDQ